MAVEQATRFRTRDGLSLHVRRYPAASESRGTILWIHGGCEHGGRYAHVMDQVIRSGWSVVLPDHRGHGVSEGERTDVTHVDRYLADLQDVQREFCPGGRANILFGHSFGGLLAIRLAQTQVEPQALVLSAPLLGLKLPVPWWKRILGRTLIQFAPKTRFRTHIDPRNMTRDPQFLEKRLADPLLIRSVTARWFFAMQDALSAAWRDAGKLRCPLLALQGLADRTVDPAAVDRFLQRTSATPRELITFPEHVHEVLQEADWEQTTHRMIHWLDQVAGPTTSSV